MKARVYLETSFISYLVGRPSRDAITAARQFSSRDFWSERRHQYELVVSELVEEECSRGDQEQVARRKVFLAEASLLPISGAILELAGSLVGPGLIPGRECWSMAADTSQSVPPTNWREREGREPWEDEVLLQLYEQRKAWAAEHGYDLKRMIDHLIERQKENPRMSRDVPPEGGTSQPR